MQPSESSSGGEFLEQSGEYRIAASREAVWEALNDAQVLGECIEGCQHIEKVDEQHFNVAVKAKIGPVSATFNAELELSDLNPPASYVINGNAKGGAAGFAKGGAEVELAEDGDATLLRYAVKANVGGKLAQVGSRLVDGAARKMADDFFSAFSTRLDPGAASTVEAAAEEDGEGARYESSGSRSIWLIAFVVLALAVLFAI